MPETKRTWMYLQRPEKEGVCTQVRLRDLNIRNVKFFKTQTSLCFLFNNKYDVPATIIYSKIYQEWI